MSHKHFEIANHDEDPCGYLWSLRGLAGHWPRWNVKGWCMSGTLAPSALEACKLASGLDCRTGQQCNHPGPAQVQRQSGK